MNSTVYERKPLRWAVCLGVPLLLLSAAIWIRLTGITPPCLFYQLTGLHCIGCGAGRCAVALLQGRIYAALRAQPLLFCSLPLLGYLCCKYYLAFLFGRDVLPFPEIRNRVVGIAVLTVLLAYWVLRNIPVVPFTYLAPTAV